MTIRELHNRYTTLFQSISDSPSADSRIIICHDLGLDGTAFMLSMDKELSDAQSDLLERDLKRRLDGEPVAYVTGERGFYECIFKVSNDTLIPRADTEILVENAISDICSRMAGLETIKILDLCCGTGCIGISVAKVLARSFKSVELTLSDISEGAMRICKENVQNLITEPRIKVTLTIGDLFRTISESGFNAILSNPPYIRTDVIPNLEKQVLFEPHGALDGGKDGLAFYRDIVLEAKGHLAPGALLAMEIGYDQGAEVSKLLSDHGYRDVEVIKDLGNRDRVVKALN